VGHELLTLLCFPRHMAAAAAPRSTAHRGDTHDALSSSQALWCAV